MPASSNFFAICSSVRGLAESSSSIIFLTSRLRVSSDIPPPSGPFTDSLKNDRSSSTPWDVCAYLLATARLTVEGWTPTSSATSMMIKEVAEEVGVHPSTVSRAVASKYAHTSQGVLELRSFFSESVNGPEGGAMSLLTLKRLVKKMIEEEDATHPLTDEQLAKKLDDVGIHVTRRTVAKYREDMRIPSTHQRREKN